MIDIPAAALDVARERLGETANAVTWLTADLLDAPLPQARYDLWHDRAVFHFLTLAEQRAHYLRQLGTTQPFLYALFRRTSADTMGDMR